MICFPNAKINLGLSVIKKRPDGFHAVETVMVPAGLSDILEVIKAPDGKLNFVISGQMITGDPESNLVMKAWDIMQSEFNLPPVHIQLHKVIPSGAGLGGGSADAAEMIKLCNRLFSLDLDAKKMEDLVRPLGSDCPFFIHNQSALATGRGDELQPITLDLSHYFIVIIKPEIHIQTVEAYSWIHPAHKEKTLIEFVNLQPWQWKKYLVNDFEKPVFQHYPEIQMIRDKLYDKGAIYASLTGSGAAVYGIFEKPMNLKKDFSDCFYWQGKAST
ncbi:MAG: 4-(cytidine 5'-diphospho)-2-C-methyl-D-erythritol kinase [Bacteroidetes bacterium]|nr:4-(cytidine 5'-diphospho)-2-C-methyl-D-erythritol kinase [Bacteroidota bacterium]